MDRDVHQMVINTSEDPSTRSALMHQINIPVRVHGQQMIVRQEQFGQPSQIYRGQGLPTRLSRSTRNSFIIQSLAELPEESPTSVSTNWGASRMHHNNASAIKCPIMMLKNPEADLHMAHIINDNQTNRQVSESSGDVPYGAVNVGPNVGQLRGEVPYGAVNVGPNIGQFPVIDSPAMYSYVQGAGAQAQPILTNVTYQCNSAVAAVSCGNFSNVLGSRRNDGSLDQNAMFQANTATPYLTQNIPQSYHHRQHSTENGIRDFRARSVFGDNPNRGSSYGLPNGMLRQPPVTLDWSQNVNIRLREKEQVRECLVPGHIIQVSGPPMVGKSTTVRQAFSEAALVNKQYVLPVSQHHVTCKTAFTFQDFLSCLAEKFCPQTTTSCSLDADCVLEMIRSSLGQCQPCHHVLVFHHCENLREHPDGNQFLDFLARVVNETAHVPITVFFTTYKPFCLPKKGSTKHLTIATLSIEEIIVLLQHYVPDIDHVTYSQILAKTFCFPEAVRLVVDQYLSDEQCRVSPEELEKKVNGDHRLLAQLFDRRLQEVDNWVSKSSLWFLTHFGHSVESSFTEAHLEYVNRSDTDQAGAHRIICSLKRNHVVRTLPKINRLVIHPLVVYYFVKSRDKEKQVMPSKWFDNTCNRYTHFLGRVLVSVEASMQEHGKKGLVFGCLFQEWPNVRYAIQMALNCSHDTYQTFMKIAVSSSGLILKFFTREAQSFYWGLYTSAQIYGTRHELAVVEALLGQAMAGGAGRDWDIADRYLESAIRRLSEFGNSYFLGFAILRKGIMLHRQGKYEQSFGYFTKARNVLLHVNPWALGETFHVSEEKIFQEIITQEIHETIPLIFTGHNKLARQRLDMLLELIQNSCENHPELATVLNLIGLTEQRGNKDNVSAIRWYILSYKERLYYAKMCPENLLAVLNNIGVILFNQGKMNECMRYLHQALDIRRECGWTHYYTGLTLVHLAEILMKTGNLAEAFKRALEAERIFSATVEDHDMRLRVNSVLAHMRAALSQALSNRSTSSDVPTEASGQSFFGRPSGEAGNHASGRQTELEDNDARHEVSFTSSQLFGAVGNDTAGDDTAGDDTAGDDTAGDDTAGDDTAGDDDVGQYLRKTAHKQQGQVYNSIHEYPVGQDTVHITTTIEPCDLQMTTEGYLQRILQIADTMTGTPSDDGLSVIMCTLEHLMLLNLQNSPVKFQEYRAAFEKFSQDNPWLEETDAAGGDSADSRLRYLIKHKDIYLYVMCTPYADLNLITFINHMQKACLTCQYAVDIFTTRLWASEATHYMQGRNRRCERMRHLDQLRVDSLRTPRDCMRSATVRPDSAADEGMNIPGMNHLDPEMNIQNRDSTSRNRTQNRDPCCAANLKDMPFGGPPQAGLPNFHELVSSSSIPNSHSIYQFQDSDQSAGRPSFIDLHQAPAVPPSCNFSPRIVHAQIEILDKIQNGSAGLPVLPYVFPTKDIESVPHAPHTAARQPVEQSDNEDQDSSWTCQDILTSQSGRELLVMVPQDGSTFEKLDLCRGQPLVRESLDHGRWYGHSGTGINVRQTIPEIGNRGRQTIPEIGNRGRQTIPEIGNRGRQTIPDIGNHGRQTIPEIGNRCRQTIPDIGNRGRQTIPETSINGRETIPGHNCCSIRTDHASDENQPDGYSKSQLVLQEYGSVWKSHDDSSCTSIPVNELDAKEKSQQGSPPTKTLCEEFSVLDYMNRHDFYVTKTKTDELKTDNSCPEKPWNSLLNSTQEPGLPPSVEGRQFEPGLPPSFEGRQFEPGLPPSVEGRQFEPGLPPSFEGRQFEPGLPPSVEGRQLEPGLPPSFEGRQFEPVVPPSFEGRQFEPGLPPSVEGRQFEPGLPPSFEGRQFEPGLPPSFEGRQFEPGLPPSFEGRQFEPVVPPSFEGRQFASVRDMVVGSSNIVIHRSSQPVLPGTDVNLRVCNNDLQGDLTSYSENGSQVYAGCLGPSVNRLWNNSRSKIPLNISVIMQMGDPESVQGAQHDSGLESLQKSKCSDATKHDRRSCSESSSGSNRSRSYSTSSSCWEEPADHGLTQAALESGYTSEHKATKHRCKPLSGKGKLDLNLGYAGHNCSRSDHYRMAHKKASGYQDQGLSEIHNSRLENYHQADTSSTYDREQDLTVTGPPKRSQRAQDRTDRGCQNQAVGFRSALRTDSSCVVDNQNSSLTSRGPVEVSWTETPTSDESNSVNALPKANRMNRPSLLPPEAQNCQAQHQRQSVNDSEEIH